mmetsp:Transcript_7474/g.18573  ORF Transcript_7474/g.18573 Transcript_7474/m.18573 type:complete len:244 (-) Transcript_7474:139-870(-)
MSDVAEDPQLVGDGRELLERQSGVRRLRGFQGHGRALVVGQYHKTETAFAELDRLQCQVLRRNEPMLPERECRKPSHFLAHQGWHRRGQLEGVVQVCEDFLGFQSQIRLNRRRRGLRLHDGLPPLLDATRLLHRLLHRPLQPELRLGAADFFFDKHCKRLALVPFSVPLPCAGGDHKGGEQNQLHKRICGAGGAAEPEDAKAIDQHASQIQEVRQPPAHLQRHVRQDDDAGQSNEQWGVVLMS